VIELMLFFVVVYWLIFLLLVFFSFVVVVSISVSVLVLMVVLICVVGLFDSWVGFGDGNGMCWVSGYEWKLCCSVRLEGL